MLENLPGGLWTLITNKWWRRGDQPTETAGRRWRREPTRWPRIEAAWWKLPAPASCQSRPTLPTVSVTGRTPAPARVTRPCPPPCPPSPPASRLTRAWWPPPPSVRDRTAPPPPPHTPRPGWPGTTQTTSTTTSTTSNWTTSASALTSSESISALRERRRWSARRVERGKKPRVWRCGNLINNIYKLAFCAAGPQVNGWQRYNSWINQLNQLFIMLPHALISYNLQS